MLLVVMVHIEGFGIFIEEFHISVLRRLCEAIMLPLFFFISGLVAKEMFFKDLIKSVLRLVIPALILGLIHSLYIQKDIISFFCNIYKYGYWFTITLAEMLVLFYSVTKVSKNKVGIVRNLILYSCLLYVLKVPFNSYPILDKVGDMFCLHQLLLYFHFFAIGYIFKQFRDYFSKILNSELVFITSITVFITALYVKCIFSDDQLAISIPLKIYRALQDPILGYTGIIILVRYFVSIEKFLSSSFLGKMLCNIGKHTLEIYLLHYFFIPKLPVIGVFLVSYPNLILELIISLIIATIVIFICIITSWCIRSNSVMGFILVGFKPKCRSLK